MIVAAIEHDVALIGAVGSILVATVTGMFMLGARWLDKRHTQRAEAYVELNTAEHLRSLAVLREIRTDIGDVKADVRDVKADVRDLRARVTDLEEELPYVEP